MTEPTPIPPADDLPARLEAVLTDRFIALGNPFSEMRRQERGPDGWPASHPVGPRHVAEVLRELLAESTPIPPVTGASCGAERPAYPSRGPQEARGGGCAPVSRPPAPEAGPGASTPENGAQGRHADRATLRKLIAGALAREDAHNAGYDHGFVSTYGIDDETDGFVDAVLAVLPTPAAPLPEVWTVGGGDGEFWGLFATEAAGQRGAIDYYEEHEEPSPDYRWQPDGPRQHLLAGGEQTGIYLTREPVYGAPAPADRAAVLAEVERVIRRALGNCSYRAADGCDFCNGVDAALEQIRRMADEAQPAPEGDARAEFAVVAWGNAFDRAHAAEQKIAAARDLARGWTRLAPADDWGDSTHATALADAGRQLLHILGDEVTGR